MPRRPRLHLPGIPQHIVQRGNNRQPIFFCDDDRRRFLEWLGEYARESGTELHAYCLMSNHVHLLLTAASAEALSELMQAVGRRYVLYVNRRHERSGGLWQGRYHASHVQSERYLLACMRYVELNPVRAGLVASPEAHRWSSYRANALGAADALITPHGEYLAIASNAEARRRWYREMFVAATEEIDRARIRAAMQHGMPLGNQRFEDVVTQQLHHGAEPRPRGRPKNGV